jgi:hypothetical protein
MYFGGFFRGRPALSSEIRTVKTGFSFIVRSEAICLIIESLTMMAEGAKLNEVPEGAGDVSEQFITQHKRTIFIGGVCLALRFFLQHFIWLFAFPECRGIPASTPPASDKIRNAAVSHFLIAR